MVKCGIMSYYMNDGGYKETTSATEGLPAPAQRVIEHEPPTLQAIEIAGALQSILHTIEGRDFTLDSQQEDALTYLGKALVDGTTSGYIEMATGTGKTTIEALVAEAAVKAGKRVLMVAPKITIANQLAGQDPANPTGLARFTDLPEHTTTGRHYGNSRAKASDQVVITTYQGLLNDARQDHATLGTFDVIIADECHRGLGAQTATAMKSIFPDAIKLGFSATPDYAIDRTSEEVFNERIFEYSLIEAVEAGKTSPIRTLLYETEQTLSLFDARREFTERELAPLIDSLERNGTAFQLAMAFARDGRQGIIACIPGEENVHARVMASMLNDQEGIRAAEVGVHLTEKQNTQRLNAFQEGALNVLTFTRALEEGWDSDKASYCINMAPTSSPVRTKQLLGRVLRRNPDGRESIYIDFIDKKVGTDKTQYTAMHALGLDTIDTERVLGGGADSSTVAQERKGRHSLVLPMLDTALLQHLTRSNGLLLNDVLATQHIDTVDPLTQHWERILRKEGMPAEITENEIFSIDLRKKYELTAARMTKRSGGIEPTAEEVLVEIQEAYKISEIEQNIIDTYGIKLPVDVSELDEAAIVDEGTSEYAALLAQNRRDIQKILKAIHSRKRSIIEARYGLKTGIEQSFNEIAETHSISAGRTNQIHSMTLADIRYAPDSELRHDPFDIIPLDPEPQLIKEKPPIAPSILYEKGLALRADSFSVQLFEETLERASSKNYGLTKQYGWSEFQSAISTYTNMYAIEEIPYLRGKEHIELIVDERQQLIAERIEHYEKRKAYFETRPSPAPTQQHQRDATIDQINQSIRDLKQHSSRLSRLETTHKEFYDNLS